MYQPLGEQDTICLQQRLFERNYPAMFDQEQSGAAIPGDAMRDVTYISYTQSKVTLRNARRASPGTQKGIDMRGCPHANQAPHNSAQALHIPWGKIARFDQF